MVVRVGVKGFVVTELALKVQMLMLNALFTILINGVNATLILAQKILVNILEIVLKDKDSIAVKVDKFLMVVEVEELIIIKEDDMVVVSQDVVEEVATTITINTTIIINKRLKSNLDLIRNLNDYLFSLLIIVSFIFSEK